MCVEAAAAVLRKCDAATHVISSTRHMIVFAITINRNNEVNTCSENDVLLLCLLSSRTMTSEAAASAANTCSCASEV
jgi:hypothetical protein